MKLRSGWQAASAIAAVLAAASAPGATLTPVAGYTGTDASGSAAIDTSVLAINDDGYMTGGISFADGSEDAFLRSPTGAYTLFSYGTDIQTEGRAINNSNVVVGYASQDTGLQLANEFSWSSGAGFTTLQTGGTPLNGIAQGINSAGVIVGDYYTPATPYGYNRNGYILNGSSFTTLTATDPVNPPANALQTTARGINDNGVVVGWLVDGNGVDEGWIYPLAGTPSVVNYPGALTQNGTVLEAVNNNGIAAGQWTDAAGNPHSFTYDIATATFTSINVPSATEVQAFGLNNLGQVAITSDVGSYIYDPNGVGGASETVFMPVAGANTPPNVSEFEINVQPGFVYDVDPQSSAGFIFTDGNGPLFASVTAPSGVAPGNEFQLWLYDSTTHQWVFDTDITGGAAFDFAGGGVGEFELLGIPQSTVDNPTSFVAGLTFESAGTFDGEEIAVGVPEPSTWATVLIGLGLAGAGLRARRRTPAIA
jgi:hypothetical protein